MRVRFSRTVRRYMRDPHLYSPEHVWTNEASDVADWLLGACAAEPDVDDAVLLATVHVAHPEVSFSDLERVWQRLQDFPHIFEIAAARHTLDNYDLNGVYRTAVPLTLTHVAHRKWTVPMLDFWTPS